ncbi:MAG: pyridoxine 5'-phosphate synthase, partial [Candidatus Dadabacteria bacterium]|nr:pyridoxine 5'-phosphate synthase [Candidatus Dadabacteria bacterium]
MKTRLNVNVDHVATLRQARMGDEPDPVTAAAQAELAGASGIVVHLREDRRHIQERDLLLLRQTVQTKLNMEMAVTDEMIEIACETLPDVVTLVPEKRQEITTEGGLDVRGDTERIAAGIEKLKSSGLFVSIFIDPDPEQISA